MATQTTLAWTLQKPAARLKTAKQTPLDYQIHYPEPAPGFHWEHQRQIFFFFTLHSVFEKYYDQAAERVDEIAERILMLGGTPMHTCQDYLDKFFAFGLSERKQCR